MSVFCTLFFFFYSLFYKALMSVKLCSVYSTTATVFSFKSCTVICVCGSLVEPPHFINHLKSRLWSQPLKKECKIVTAWMCSSVLWAYWAITRPFWNLKTFITDSVGEKTWKFTFEHGYPDLRVLNSYYLSVWEMFQSCVNLQIFPCTDSMWACYKLRTQTEMLRINLDISEFPLSYSERMIDSTVCV